MTNEFEDLVDGQYREAPQQSTYVVRACSGLRALSSTSPLSHFSKSLPSTQAFIGPHIKTNTFAPPPINKQRTH